VCDYAIKQVMLLPWCVYAFVCGGDFLKKYRRILVKFWGKWALGQKNI